MHVTRHVTMVVHNDSIKEAFEGDIGVLGASINSDIRVEVLTSRENALLEGNTVYIDPIVISIPNVFSKVPAEERFGTFRELWPVNKIIRALQVRSAHSPLDKNTSSVISLRIITRGFIDHWLLILLILLNLLI